MKSVIVPTWNAGALIDNCLASILDQLAAADELIVIDNASRDGTPDRIAARYPQITLVRLPENTGFAGGVNHGLQRARGTELILINQDVVLQAGCLAALSAQLASGPAIVGCKLLYPDGVTIQHAGGILQRPRAIADHFGYGQIDDGRWNTVTEVDYVTGAVFAFNRAVLDASGVFDEGFYPAYYEEGDYCFRARAAGARVIYEPGAVAIHHETQSTDKRTPAYHQAMERGRLRFVLKNYPPDQLLNEFFPAEQAYVQQVDAAFARDVCAPVYADVLMNLPPLPPDAAASIIQSLRHLRATAHQTSAALRDQPTISESPMSEPLPSSDFFPLPEPFSPLDVPALREHEFESTVPVVGPLIAGLRRALYALTAKWPLRVALEQQVRINRQLVQRLQDHEARMYHLEAVLRDHAMWLRDHETLLHNHEALLRNYEALLRNYEALLRNYEALLQEYDERLIDQDHDLAQLSRVTAENELRLRHLAARSLDLLNPSS